MTYGPFKVTYELALEFTLVINLGVSSGCDGLR